MIAERSTTLFAPAILGGFLLSLLPNSGALIAQDSDETMSVEGISTADALSTEGIEFFESRIRPVLVRECYSCHSSQAGQSKGGLQLDTKTGLLVGGDSGPALIPGSLDDSLIWSAINYNDFEMPPGKQLPPQAIDDFQSWIEMGAPDPRVPNATMAASTVTDEDVERGRGFWSFVSPQMPQVPDAGRSWALGEIDRFIAEKLHEAELEPAADADAATLLRRLYFDLTGMPPTPGLRERFLADWSRDEEASVRAVVDELLASPQFGERWGRHWLDVARYAESSGMEVNATFSQAWRYRDYVIDSFNADKPYDRFIQEQIAGDLLPVETDDEWAANLVATGFLALGPKTLTEQNPRQFAADLIDEQIDATTRVVLGVSVACARCHDHKFDPIPQTDYYAMAGIFRSTRTYYGTIDTQQNRRPSKLIRLPVADDQPVGPSLTGEQMQTLRERLSEIDEKLLEVARLRREARRSDKPPANAQQAFRQYNLLNTQRSAIQSLLDSCDEQGNPRALCMGVQPVEQPVNATFLVRGEVDQPGDQVPRGFVRVLAGSPPEISGDSAGRLELAEWMTGRDNPLAARVMVNRLWQHLIGQAIVPTTDNFGATGVAPSHPELLDWLAVTFMDDGWSVKQMIRRIATSRTYRMASTHDERAFQQDPENRLLWRGNESRLDAEALRDAMLAVCGKLDPDRPVASDVARVGETVSRSGVLRETATTVLREMDQRPGNDGDRSQRPQRRDRTGREAQARREAQDRSSGTVTERFLGTSNQPQADPVAFYRSVYLPVVRDYVPRSLEVFDFAESSMIVGTREVSNTPDQGLYFLNNRLVIYCADTLARRVADEATTINGQIERAFELCYGRPATRTEKTVAREFYNEFESTGDNPEHVKLAALCQAILASAEFRIVD